MFRDKFTPGNLLRLSPVLLLILAMINSYYIVIEGHVGVVKRFGEARHQENPGLHFKIPFIETVELIEVRTRK
ncbi:MAG: SPFH domain-containing protein, partial [Gammaproteobacteria bacterium]|nr:SPFH domain-containing protein [Gammaproteobacteria bacterium]